jgi:hypothetical protein
MRTRTLALIALGAIVLLVALSRQSGNQQLTVIRAKRRSRLSSQTVSTRRIPWSNARNSSLPSS